MTNNAAENLSHVSTKASKRRAISALAIIVVVALVLRAVVTILLPESEWRDAQQYHDLARNLLAGNGFSLEHAAPYKPTMFREPLYPAFLAFAYLLPGPDVGMARALQAMLGAATCVCTFLLARKVTGSQRIAVIAAMLTAVQPTLLLYTAKILSETLSAFMATLGLLFFAHAWVTRRPRWFAIAGLVLGLTALVRSALILLPPCLVAVYALGWWRSRRDQRASVEPPASAPVAPRQLAMSLGAFVAVLALTIAPWCVRNKVEFGTSAITVRIGAMLFARARTFDESDDAAGAETWRYLKIFYDQGLNDPAVDAKLGEIGLERISAEPLRYLAGNPGQVVHLWVCGSESVPVQSCSSTKSCVKKAVKLLVPTAFGVLFGFVMLGCALLVRRGGAALIPPISVAYLTVLHSFLALNSCRYAIPVLAVAMIPAAVGLDWLWTKARIWRSRSVAA